MAFARFMSGPLGRGLRIVAGSVLVIVGIALAIGGDTPGLVGGLLLALLGAAVVVAGAANVCFIAPIIRAPFRGRRARDSA